MNWEWLSRNAQQILAWTLDHVWLAAAPTVLGLLLALPLGAIAHRYRWSYATLITLAGLLYTVPSIALFVVLPAVLGTRILDPLNVVVALTLYTVALLVRVVADALDAVPPLVVASATAMGYQPLRSLLTVQLPLAIPVIGAGLRVAAVSNVSLVSVAALLGIPQLGQLFTVGFQLDFFTPIWAGIVLCLVLAGIFDAIIQILVRITTPWARAVKAR
ncbi:ABC transporter permease [Nakamurella multipartita]|jgi:osmoprotectant transport system permease protein|uniref:Binding-protein-dependent transport systems inner membrane component n=1 Tax=Nakamurella multipartita (strain ATCC 700099 / DSM 44233 / CIP 104796 / JCM 9543 / NBRC 105858 / Y-104) TaxID=479431 RepID=C8XEE8_NAKMY|nr:ABC transporter permease subunit [Nakamurella multipartita]ACV77806.1 binding-protein-dependent transport systems inner membrane component [Nakamurella multipartita DSM 44233]HOZ58584.1 ABC transporter permease subunit [Nakamurella multipartita]